jgi:hypothetical protein
VCEDAGTRPFLPPNPQPYPMQEAFDDGSNGKEQTCCAGGNSAKFVRRD